MASGDRVPRRAFLISTLLGAAAVTSCSGDSAPSSRDVRVSSVLSPDDYDHPGMMALLRTPRRHKQVFLALGLPTTLLGKLHLAKPDANEIYGKMQMAMNAYDFSLDRSGATLAALGVLTGDSVVLGLNDAMWAKYDIGQRFDLNRGNIYYYAKSNLDPRAAPNDPKGLYQDWSAQAVLRRGGSFMVCHNALSTVATAIVLRSKLSMDTVLADMRQNLMPGFLLVPAGLAAVQLAQENGWKLFSPI